MALVTGGSRGLGFLLAERLLAEGCRVAICARDEETLARARKRLGDDDRVLALPCDVADPEQVKRTVTSVVERFGSLDVLVNNAANIQVVPLEALELEDFRRAMDVTFMGTVHATLAAIPHMRAQGGGRILNVTSIGGKVAVPHLLPYDSAKFAAVGFSEGLRAAVAEDGITVTTVVPGLMRTGSPVHVEYGGQAAKEYAWFAFSDIFPGTAMSAAAAADRMVLALRRGEAEVTLSWQARVLRAAHDLSPGGMSRAMTLVARMLPDSDGASSRSRSRGRDLRGTLPGPVERALERAGEASNQAPTDVA